MQGQHCTQMCNCHHLLSTHNVTGTLLEGALQLVYLITVGAKEVILTILQVPSVSRFKNWLFSETPICTVLKPGSPRHTLAPLHLIQRERGAPKWYVIERRRSSAKLKVKLYTPKYYKLLDLEVSKRHFCRVCQHDKIRKMG